MVRISSRLRASKPFLLSARSCSLVMVDVGTRLIASCWESGDVTGRSGDVLEGAGSVCRLPTDCVLACGSGSRKGIGSSFRLPTDCVLACGSGSRKGMGSSFRLPTDCVLACGSGSRKGMINCAPTLGPCGVLDCAKAVDEALGEGAMNCAPTKWGVYCWMTGLYQRDSVIRRSWSQVKRLSRK